MPAPRILIIDDEPDLLKVFRKRLEISGFQVSCLSTGVDAVKKVQEIRPNLILLDIVLPDENGYDVCYDLKSDPATSFVPIILTTAKAEWKRDLEDIGRFTKADDFIAKPFESQDLIDKINRLLNS
jgi:DNA-binding response OmpR family regulator